MPKTSINIAVLNGERYIESCLDSVFNQAYPPELMELNILDNGSTDATIRLIQNLTASRVSAFSSFKFIESKKNLGMWGGQEELLKHSSGEYVIFLSVDVILDKNFVVNAVKEMELDPQVGALQAKIYQYNVSDLNSKSYVLSPTLIDTCGFKIERSRRVTNIGHGENDRGQYNRLQEIFGVEGAVPVFRRSSLESIRIPVGDGSEIADHDLFWYAEDLDVAWRIKLAGWKEIFCPNVIAWHDRQTTKDINRSKYPSAPNLGYLRRVPKRRGIPIRKRQLEWRNIRWTIVKNDFIINVLKDLPYILWREFMVLGYTILFQPGVFAAFPELCAGIPRMIRKRKHILPKARISAGEIHKFFK
ncbi:MAG: Glycosyl transferase family protein [Candidatus Yanofskybacteria bacterium GW2011_GWA1_48_10]|uniref:Glycosyl transferase family protein n=2 Tax=Candidatus Yanofskyibacteriota TaxID=1752733 RepID=A0A0G1U7S2_9BACT|nr:MAG: Glycosyl transferase family protein [Candidatus Yanofskybacteria bacterium GW2011_GWA1_48_10]OGN06601.1 MAG: hypothetical protein A2669_03080 [Candidatus Yanofskybacteria bacterium RIFCSPHIGHO2_01_FULL_48_25b]